MALLQLGGLLILGLGSLALGVSLPAPQPSTCYGSTAQGRLSQGWALPASGSNFQAYSLLGVAAGRNFLHSQVQQVVLDAYGRLETSTPTSHFVYGETGFATGGRFAPHKTHQNGLSVDFFVPVLDRAGQSATLPSGPFNRFGYDIEFSRRGVYDHYRIDFAAMASHLWALKAAADRQGLKIGRVIFDNDLQPLLFRSAGGAKLKAAMPFSTTTPWVRHDEHYHIDFVVQCQPLR